MLSVVALNYRFQMSLETAQSSEGLFHRGEALRIIQERLGKCSAIDDSTIGAVASLANHDVSETEILDSDTGPVNMM